MGELLIASGLALLLALLGWSDQFKSWHRETIEAEKDFAEKQGISLKNLRPLLRDNSSPIEKLQAINKIKKNISEDQNLDELIIVKFSNLDKRRSRLENLYKIKYLLIVLLTISFFISGLTSCFIDETTITYFLGLKMPSAFLSLLICILFSLGILFFTVYLNKEETNYRDDFFQIMGEL